MLGQESSSEAVEERLAQIRDTLEHAANEGCFSVEVALNNGSFGSAQWWWDARNQDAVGDYVTGLGCNCRFRNPRLSDSLYPSLNVDWFELDEVAALVNEEHARVKSEQEAGSAKHWATKDFAVSIPEGFTHLNIDPERCDASRGRVWLEASGNVEFNVSVRAGVELSQLEVVVAEWTGLSNVMVHSVDGSVERAHVPSRTSDAGMLQVVFDNPGHLFHGTKRVRFN